MLTIDVVAKDLQKGDRVTTITGDVAIVDKVQVKDETCLIIFSNGLSFHCFVHEDLNVYRPHNEINS